MQVQYPILDKCASLVDSGLKLAGAAFPISILAVLFSALH